MSMLEEIVQKRGAGESGDYRARGWCKDKEVAEIVRGLRAGRG